MTLEDPVQLQMLMYENVDIKLGCGFDLDIDFSRCQGYSAEWLNRLSLTGLIRKHPQMCWLAIVDRTPHLVAHLLELMTIKPVGINFYMFIRTNKPSIF